MTTGSENSTVTVTVFRLGSCIINRFDWGSSHNIIVINIINNTVILGRPFNRKDRIAYRERWHHSRLTSNIVFPHCLFIHKTANSVVQAILARSTCGTQSTSINNVTEGGKLAGLWQIFQAEYTSTDLPSK